jgi:hypothetical protein
MVDWTAADINADAKELQKAGEQAVAGGPSSDAARAFQKEIDGMYNRHGADYVRAVFKQVKQDVGGVNAFSEAASGSNADQLCFLHGIVRSTARLVSGQDDPISQVCGYSTPMPPTMFHVEVPYNIYSQPDIYNQANFYNQRRVRK